MQNNNSDIVDVVGVTPIPSPLPSSAADPPPAPPADEGGGLQGTRARELDIETGEERVDIVEGAVRPRETMSSSTHAETGYSSPPSSFYEEVEAEAGAEAEVEAEEEEEEEEEEGEGEGKDEEEREGPVPPSTQEESTANIDEDDDSRIRCICENEEDDGFTIQCDGCLVWQHAVCVGIARHNVPETFLCEECRPSSDATVTAMAVVGAGAKKVTKRKRASSFHSTLGTTGGVNSTGVISSLPALNEITSNIVATEALPILRQLANEYERVRLRMPRLARDIPLGQVNFELCPGMVTLPSRGDLAGSLKATEVRELRGRNYGRRAGSSLARIGVFAAEDIDPGAIVGEYLGHVQPANVLEGRRPEGVTQSHILFSSASPGLIVDARKFGSALRYVRRSCRANCDVKVVLLPAPSSDDVSECVHWCLFARNTIREGEELFLPFDYGPEGNQYFRYECCCLYPELCLADDMQPSQLIDVTGSGVVGPGSGVGMTSSLGEKHHHHHHQHQPPSRKTGGISSSLLSPDNRRGSSNLVSTAQAATSRSRTAATAAAAASAAGAPDRKLSREERKLQQYIEFIERMELAEKRQAGRRSAGGAGSSHSGAASPPPSGTAASPRKGSLAASSSSSASGRRISSSASSKTASPPKKPKVRDHEGRARARAREREGEEEEEGKSSINSVPSGANYPTNAQIQVITNDNGTISTPSSLPSPAPSAKRMLPLKKFLVRNLEDRRASSVSSGSSPSESPTKRPPKGGETITHEDEVDVMAIDGTDSEGSSDNNGRASLPPPEPLLHVRNDPKIEQKFDPDGHQDHTAGGAGAPETPSKKRVSLSDYLLRRRSSPVDRTLGAAKESTGDSEQVPEGGGGGTAATMNKTMMTTTTTMTTTQTSPVSSYIKDDPYMMSSSGEVPTFIKPTPVEGDEEIGRMTTRRIMSPSPPPSISPAVPYTLSSSMGGPGPWSQQHNYNPHAHAHHHRYPSSASETARRESYPMPPSRGMDSLPITSYPQRPGHSIPPSSAHPHPRRSTTNHGDDVRDRYGGGGGLSSNDYRTTGRRMGAGGGGDHRGVRGRDPREARDYGHYREYRHHPPRDHYGTSLPARSGGAGDTRDYNRIMDPRDYKGESGGSGSGSGRPAGSVSPRSAPPSPYTGGDRRPPPLSAAVPPTAQYSAAPSSAPASSTSASPSSSSSSTFSHRSHQTDGRLY